MSHERSDADDAPSSPPPQAGEGAQRVEWRIRSTTRRRAKRLRRDTTDAERLIWNELRAHRINGASFRRQTPIGPYIADFVCHAARLVVGGQHFEPDNLKRDARRDAFLSAKGFRVIRFNNRDVMTNMSGVLETIAAAVQDAPSLTLPRKRGRERGVATAAASRRQKRVPS